MARAIDPVCKMEVDTNKTKFKSVYKGKTYYFCNEFCKKKFDESPSTYIK
ncbi:MAG: YHS domain-containing protein [Candidatus Aenigmatarchaeota archaeon]